MIRRRAMLLGGSVGALTLLAGFLAGCGTRESSAFNVASISIPHRSTSEAGVRGARASAASSALRHELYVFPDGAMYVYDIDHGDRLLRRVALPGVTGIRGVVASPATHTLFISHGGDSPQYPGALLAIDLVTGRVLWNRSYRRGVDSMAIDASGARIYMPDGELAPDGVWTVLSTRDGSVIGQIHAGAGAHNTVVGASGRHVYLGGVGSAYLNVAATATGRVARRVGPLRGGVRPFTVNGRETLALTTATGFLGFQVSSLTSGRVLYTRTFGPRFHYDPGSFAPTAPSHGLSFSPDERQAWIIDGPNSYVHVFDVSGLPRHGPRQVASIRLDHPFRGQEAGCSYDCARDGWLLHSRSGCRVYVGDSGDVIDTRHMRVVAFVPALRESRKFIEIDWRGGLPVATTSRTGVGYVTPGTTRYRQSCR